MDELYGKSIGIFRGFAEGGLEFRADLVAPYAADEPPLLGDFLLVETSPDIAVLGRIVSFFPSGAMSTSEADDYLAAMTRANREIPEDLKESRLRYNVDVKLLGQLSIQYGEKGKEFAYLPSLRRLPHLGARVHRPTDNAIRFICSLSLEREATGEARPEEIGHLSLGDTVFDGKGGRPEFPVSFDISHLVARRTFVFARAGYGKSNLLKLLIAKLYDREQTVGTIVFDPEGEYTFPDKTGRPGLADVPHLADRLVVFTPRAAPAGYEQFKQGDTKVNLGDLRASDVVNICIPDQYQESVFASRVRALTNRPGWEQLLDLLHTAGYGAALTRVHAIAGFAAGQRGMESAQAIVSRFTPIVSEFHDPSSHLVDAIIHHLAKGQVVVVDVSLMSSWSGEKLAALILNHLFVRNQQNFTAGTGRDLLNIIAVVEEAQSVLSPKAKETSPFVVWAKEGRKYQLGAILVTQQPGSIAQELLSQGDNFFVFHLLSANDLKALQRDNAHYSDDILAHLLNEPIKGNGYIWSAPDQPFVLPAYIQKFEAYAARAREGRGGGKLPSPRRPSAVQEYERLSVERTSGWKQHVSGLLTRAEGGFSLQKVSTLDGEAVVGVLAVDVWHVKFKIGDTLPDPLREYYLDDFRGKAIARDAEILRTLRELGVLFDPPTAYQTDPEKKKQRWHFLLRAELVKRGAKAGPGLELMTGPPQKEKGGRMPRTEEEGAEWSTE